MRRGENSHCRLDKNNFASQSVSMDSNWAAEHLQVIRTLMERSAVYRRALAPIMTYAGIIGLAGGICGLAFHINRPRSFILFWGGVGIAAMVGSFLLVRRQALKEKEPFWSPPTRRVAQALLPPFFIGAVGGALAVAVPGLGFFSAQTLPALWFLLYGCALTAAGFFMSRGIKLLGWIFILGGCGLLALGSQTSLTFPEGAGHYWMGGGFGGLQLAYGIYLYFTEQSGNET